MQHQDMGQKSCLRKEEHQNEKGWAEGGQETILEKHVSEYMVEHEKGLIAEQMCFAKILKEFLFYIHWSWLDTVEPTQPFAPYNSKAVPVDEDLTEEEQKQKWEHIKVLAEVSMYLYD